MQKKGKYNNLVTWLFTRPKVQGHKYFWPENGNTWSNFSIKLQLICIFQIFYKLCYICISFYIFQFFINSIIWTSHSTILQSWNPFIFYLSNSFFKVIISSLYFYVKLSYYQTCFIYLYAIWNPYNQLSIEVMIVVL